MLLSATCYRDIYLEGKDEVTVRSEIATLRREIERLKYKMESPSYPYENHPFPSELEQLEACREYLNEANEMLVRMGLAPDLTEEELSANATEQNIPDIRKISLAIGIYLNACYELRIYESHAELSRVLDGIPSVPISLDKDKTLGQIAELRLGEWRELYLPEQYGSSFSEPVRWRLLVEYSSGISPRFFEGNGIFPYNFESLKRLLGVED